MKALLIKDFYMLIKQMKIFIIVILVLAIMPGTSVAAFAIVYSAMIPMTAIAYDEGCKWDRFAAMMPYTVKNLVLEKYVFGYLMVTFAAIISALSKLITGLVTGSGFDVQNLVVIAVVVCIALTMQALNLPFVYKFGVEKGRFVYLAFFVLVFAVLGLFEINIEPDFSTLPNIQISILFLAIALLAVTVICNVGSILLSVRFYAKKSHQ